MKFNFLISSTLKDKIKKKFNYKRTRKGPSYPSLTRQVFDSGHETNLIRNHEA
jgi:hypothetical protein